jgi:plastocyanin
MGAGVIWIVVAAMIIGIGLATVQAQPAVTVEMRDFSFSPRDTVVSAGTTVRWVNFDDAPHQIAMTARAPGSSGLIAPGGDYTFAFMQPGQFVYRCAVHPTMLGILTVTAP